MARGALLRLRRAARAEHADPVDAWALIVDRGHPMIGRLSGVLDWPFAGFRMSSIGR